MPPVLISQAFPKPWLSLNQAFQPPPTHLGFGEWIWLEDGKRPETVKDFDKVDVVTIPYIESLDPQKRVPQPHEAAAFGWEGKIRMISLPRRHKLYRTFAPKEPLDIESLMSNPLWGLSEWSTRI